MKTAINYLLQCLEVVQEDLEFYRDGKNKPGVVDLTDDYRKEMTVKLTAEVAELQAAVKLLETADD